MSTHEKRGGFSPNLAALLRHTNPARLREERQKARETAARPTPAGFWASDETSRDLEAQINAAREREAAEPDIDATGPSAAEERPVTTGTARARARTWPRTWKLVGAASLVAATMPFLVIFAGRTKDPAGKAVASATTMPSVTAVTATGRPEAPAASFPPASATPSPRSAESATQVPRAAESTMLAPSPIPSHGAALPHNRSKSLDKPVATNPSPVPPAKSASPQDPALNE
jgi:hypothetical protein